MVREDTNHGGWEVTKKSSFRVERQRKNKYAFCFASSSLRGTKQSYNDSIRIASYLAMTTVYVKWLIN